MTEGDSQSPIENTAFELPRGAILPPFCPSCGDAGVVPARLEQFFASNAERPPEGTFEEALSAHYCEICADDRRRRDTVVFALSMATAIVLAVAVGVSIARLREHWTSLLPVWISLAVACIFFASKVERARNRVQPYAAIAGSTRLLVVPSKKGRAALQTALGAVSVPRPPVRSERTLAAWWLVSAPLLGMALPVLVTYLSLRARIVVVDPNEDDLFLVEDRLVQNVPTLRQEWPGGGLTLHLIAGKRRLELSNTDGGVRLAETVWLEPGGTYLFGLLPDGLCAYYEEQSYGDAPSRHVSQVEGGPLYKLRSDVRYYFEELPTPWGSPGQGGTLVALRLLPCKQGHRSAN